MGAPVLIEISDDKARPLDLAIQEIEAGLLPMTVRRRLPDGTYQDIPLNWLIKDKTKTG